MSELLVLGAIEIGDDIFSTLIKAGAEGATSIVKQVQGDGAASDAAAAAAQALQDAIAADTTAALAMAQSLTSDALASAAPGSAASKSRAQASADHAALDQALAAQDRAAAKLPDTVSDKRVAAAQNALAVATKRLQAAPTETYAQNLVTAWTKIVAKTQNAEIRGKADDGKASKATIDDDRPSWWTRKVLGPVPGWGVAAGLGTGAVLLLRRLL
jgi:hypothetical protein